MAKVNTAGTAVVYSTYVGGSGDDEGYGVAVDASGNAYVAGPTNSTNFPTVNPLQAAGGGNYYDAFVARLNAAGSALVYSTYLGGTGDDQAAGIAVDGSGNAYITGLTDSTDFPVANPLQAANGGGIADAFVAKVSAAGSALVYSTFLGGSGDDGGRGIALDGSGNAYVAGATDSANFPTANPLQAVFGGGYYTAFVAKIADASPGVNFFTVAPCRVVDTRGGAPIGGPCRASKPGSSRWPASAASRRPRRPSPSTWR